MTPTQNLFLEAILLAFSVSMDAFVVSFAYGSNKIKIPPVSVLVITLICGGSLGLSLLLGSVLNGYLPQTVTTALCFSILFFLGLLKLLDCVTKTLIRKHADLKKELNFSLLNFKFILQLYADPEKADIDASREISPAEATSLAIAISLDGLAVGFGAAVGNMNLWVVFLFALIVHGLAILSGSFLGNKIAHKLSFDLSWLGGVFLVVLAFLKIL